MPSLDAFMDANAAGDRKRKFEIFSQMIEEDIADFTDCVYDPSILDPCFVKYIECRLNPAAIEGKDEIFRSYLAVLTKMYLNRVREQILRLLNAKSNTSDDTRTNKLNVLKSYNKSLKILKKYDLVIDEQKWRSFLDLDIPEPGDAELPSKTNEQFQCLKDILRNDPDWRINGADPDQVSVDSDSASGRLNGISIPSITSEEDDLLDFDDMAAQNLINAAKKRQAFF